MTDKWKRIGVTGPTVERLGMYTSYDAGKTIAGVSLVFIYVVNYTGKCGLKWGEIVKENRGGKEKLLSKALPRLLTPGKDKDSDLQIGDLKDGSKSLVFMDAPTNFAVLKPVQEGFVHVVDATFIVVDLRAYPRTLAVRKATIAN